MEAETQSPNNVASLLKAEHIGYSNLSELLRKEKQLLIERNFDAFAQVLEEKHLLVSQLSQLADHRLKVLEALGCEQSELGVQDLLKRQPEYGREQLTSQWREIKAYVNECNRQNEVNAKIAHRAQATSRQILNLLKGAPHQQSLYDKTGSAGANVAGLSITHA